MQKTEKVLVCDVCSRKASDGGGGWIGGHPWDGWFHLNQHGGSTMLSELQRKRDWDICSKECLKKLAEGQIKREDDTRLDSMVKVFAEAGEIFSTPPKKSA